MNINTILNNEQQAFVDKILSLDLKKISSGSFPWFLLTGSAGTGKTTTITELIKKLDSKKSKEFGNIEITILTPTHQSARVIKSMIKEKELDKLKIFININTIHSFFNISPDIDENTGERVFIPKTNSIEITSDLYIIDESSMINKELFNIIKKFSNLI